MYAKIENDLVVEYPLSEFDLRAQHPHISFPIPFQPPDGYARVISMDPPALAAGEALDEQSPSLVEGYWVQTWSVRQMTQTEIDAAAYERRRRLSVTPRQFRKALRVMELYDDAVAILEQAGDPDIMDAWEYATSFERLDPLIDQMATAMGKTAAETDALFELAASFSFGA